MEGGLPLEISGLGLMGIYTQYIDYGNTVFTRCGYALHGFKYCLRVVLYGCIEISSPRLFAPH
jgi:hypothetical protein